MVKRTRLLGVDNVALVEEIVVAELRGREMSSGLGSRIDVTSYLVAEEAAGDVDFLASHDNNLLAGQDLLGDDRGQSTKEVTLAINHDGCRGECGHNANLYRT